MGRPAGGRAQRGLVGQLEIERSRTVTLSARYNWGLETNEVEYTYFTFSVGFGLGS